MKNEIKIELDENLEIFEDDKDTYEEIIFEGCINSELSKSTDFGNDKHDNLIKSKDLNSKNIEFKNPLEFVDEFENKLRFINETKERLTLSQILNFNKDYKNEKRYSYNICSKLNERYFSLTQNFEFKSNPTSICFADNTAFVGNACGITRVFEYDDSFREKIPPIVLSDVSKNHSVTSIDFKLIRSKPFLAIGYSNGLILLYDIIKKVEISRVSKIHKSSILHLKLLPSSKYCLFSSDIEGNMYLYEESQNIFGHYSLVATNINEKQIISCIDVCLQDSYYNKNLDSRSLIAFGEINHVVIMSLDPNPNLLNKISLKNDEDNKNILLLAWGRGTIPCNSSYENPLLAIYWKKIIQLVSLTERENEKIQFHLNGYYILDSEIISMFFLSYSTILVFYSTSEFQLLYTGNFIDGTIPEGVDIKHFSLISKVKEFVEISPRIKSLDGLLIFGSIIKNCMTNKEMILYNNTLSKSLNKIFIMQKGNKENFYFTEFELEKWDEFITRVIEQGEIMRALTTSLGMHREKIKGFACLPDLSKIRYEIQLPKFKKFIDILVEKNIDKINHSKAINQSLIDELTYILELGLELNLSYFLFHCIEPKFNNINKNFIFFFAFETLALQGDFGYIKIDNTSIKKIVNFYVVKEEIKLLENILLKLDLQLASTDYLAEIAWKYNMHSLLISVKSTCMQEELVYLFIDPLNKITDNFKKLSNFEKLDLLKLYIQNPSKVDSTKKYIGFKLLWYIHLCLIGKRYPNKKEGNIIPSNIFPNLIFLIVQWILIQDNYLLLISIDPKIMFFLLLIIFENHNISRLIRDYENNHLTIPYAINYSNIFKEIVNISYFNIEKIENININIKSILSIFILKVSLLPYLQIEESACIKNLIYILSPDDCHGTESTKHFYQLKENLDEKYNNNEIEEMILEYLIVQAKSISEDSLHSLIRIAENSNYLLILSYLYEKVGKFAKCLECKIMIEKKIKKNIENINNIKNKNSILPFQTNFNIIKIPPLMIWIFSIISKLNEAQNEEFKHSIKKYSLDLIYIDVYKLVSIIEILFKGNHGIYIDTFHESKIDQLTYVENLIKCKQESIFQEMIVQDQNEASTEYQQYNNILKLHISLLSLLKPKEVLNVIKKNKCYPLAECIDICKNAKIPEAEAYLLYKTNLYQESLEKYLEIINGLLNELVVTFNSKNEQQLLDCFRMTIKICIKNEKRVLPNETNLFWNKLFDKLYEMWNSFQNKINISDNIMKIKMEENPIIKLMNYCIGKLLEEMNKYISLESVIKKFTQEGSELHFKGFNEIFLSFIFSIGVQERMLCIFSKYFKFTIFQDIKAISETRACGRQIKSNFCSKCKGFIYINSTIFAFRCGHLFHTKCLLYSNKIQCPFCSFKNEICINDDPMKIKDQNDKQLQLENEAELNEENLTPYGEKSEELSYSEINDYFKRLKLHEKSFCKSFPFIINENNKLE